jgi:SAM-dependent methyltransferase
MVQSALDIQSVADFGCGTGEWLAAWRELGVVDVVGVDGDWVPRSMLVFDLRQFVAADLSRPLSIGRRFDLAMSLEVGEHLPRAAAATLVDTLINHAAVVLFSAAAPGQGGEHHINERPHSFWRDLFRDRGFWLIDALRPGLAATTDVAPWYRYNVMLFVDQSAARALPPDLLAHRVPDDCPVASYAPRMLRVWRQLARWLPPTVMTVLARRLRRSNWPSTHVA